MASIRECDARSMQALLKRMASPSEYRIDIRRRGYLPTFQCGPYREVRQASRCSFNFQEGKVGIEIDRLAVFIDTPYGGRLFAHHVGAARQGRQPAVPGRHGRA